MTGTCPACGGRSLQDVYQQAGVPAHSCLLLDTESDARAFPTGDLAIAFCASCGFLTNAAFRPELERYSTRYEETQGFSAHFQAFAEQLADRWVDRYGLRDRRILEIGCGKGEFLQAICDAGGNTGLGIDPAFVPDRFDAGDRITVIQDLYDERFGPIEADAVICRHTLEHIAPVEEFLRTLRRDLAGATDTVVLFELPDVRRVLDERAFWDVYYEHCSYFSLGSLARLFRRTGFEVLDLDVVFDGQYLLIEAVPTATPPTGSPTHPEEDDLELLAKLAGGFADDVGTVVDINPYKHGKFMAGTGHRIVGPADLVDQPPDLVVAMNPTYRGEIAAQLDDLGLHPTLVTV